MLRIPLNTLVAIVAFIGGLGGGLVFPILPALGLNLGIPGFLIGLILSSNRIARLVFNLPAGYLYHRLGPRLTLTGALLIGTVGMLGFSAALASDIPAAWLLAARFVHGTGMAFLLVGAQAAVLGNSDKANRGRQTAVVRVALNSAVPGGLILGGLLADIYSDNVAFLAGAAVTFSGAIMAAVLLPSRKPVAMGSDHTGPENGLPDDDGQGFRALFHSRNLPALVSAWSFNFLIFMTIQGALMATLVLLVKERDISVFGMAAQGSSGIVMALMIAVAALSAFAIGRTIDAFPLRSTPLIPSLLGMATGLAIFALAPSLPVMLLGAAVTGLFYNSVTLPMMALLGDSTSARQYGPAVAVFQWCGDVGGTIGPIAGIEIATHFGLVTLYLLLAALPALAIGVALWLRHYEQSQTNSPVWAIAPPLTASQRS